VVSKKAKADEGEYPGELGMHHGPRDLQQSRRFNTKICTLAGFDRLKPATATSSLSNIETSDGSLIKIVLVFENLEIFSAYVTLTFTLTGWLVVSCAESASGTKIAAFFLHLAAMTSHSACNVPVCGATVVISSDPLFPT
jgi:hypothetical protein